MANDPAPFNYSDKLAFLRAACVDPALVRTDLAVLAVMLDYANRQTRESFMSVATMVRDSGVPRTTVIRAIQRLTSAAWIVGKKRNGATTEYRLTGPMGGTGAVGGTGATWNATGATRVLRTGPMGGTEAVPSTEHEQKEKQNKKKQESARVVGTNALVLPSWLPEDAWQMWVEHRKQVGRKFTDRAKQLAIANLDQLRGEGHDVRKLVELAIESGWSKLYPRPETRIAGRAVGAIPRDHRADEEIEAANLEQLARFGMEVAP